jgi:signal transduction histidine kinase
VAATPPSANPRQAAAALHTIAATAREAQAEMRRALGILSDRPGAPLEPQPGVDELAALVARTREAGLAVAFTTEGRPRPLAPGAGLTLYRVAQEALTNVARPRRPEAGD